MSRRKVETFPKLTREQIESCLKLGSAEYAAGEEYHRGRYDPERGGPAMAKLREVRKAHAALVARSQPDPDAVARAERAVVKAAVVVADVCENSGTATREFDYALARACAAVARLQKARGRAKK